MTTPANPALGFWLRHVAAAGGLWEPEGPAAYVVLPPPLRDAGGRVRGANAAFQDVTAARQHTDALLRESEERFRNMADASPVIMWLGDTQKGLELRE